MGAAVGACRALTRLIGENGIHHRDGAGNGSPCGKLAMAQLVMREVVKEFPAPHGTLRILDGVSLALSARENLAVVGPSGCGKSTLLHIAGTLDEPTRGTVTLDGQNPFQLNAQDLAAFRNQRIGFIFQEHCLLPQLTALENVLIPVLAQRRVAAADVDRARQLLVEVDLAARADHRPGELSGGERQRVAVARALICSPMLVLADEPTGSLDEANAGAVGQMLLDVSCRLGTMLICVTHSQPLARLFQRQGRLTGGVLQELTVDA